jgi:hypothetical protein
MDTMTKTILIVLICVVSPACRGTSSQNANQQTTAQVSEAAQAQRIKAQAQELADSMMRDDFEKVIDLTYPKLVGLLGGREAAVAAMKQESSEMLSDNMQLVSHKIGEPRDFVQVEGERYAIVPSTMQIRVPEGMLVGEAFMIAVSVDGGQNWTFVDSGGGNANPKLLKDLFPAAADKLRMPETKPPVLHPTPKQ